MSEDDFFRKLRKIPYEDMDRIMSGQKRIWNDIESDDPEMENFLLEKGGWTQEEYQREHWSRMRDYMAKILDSMRGIDKDIK
jgi:hypothetical protein